MSHNSPLLGFFLVTVNLIRLVARRILKHYSNRSVGEVHDFARDRHLLTREDVNDHRNVMVPHNLLLIDIFQVLVGVVRSVAMTTKNYSRERSTVDVEWFVAHRRCQFA